MKFADSQSVDLFNMKNKDKKLPLHEFNYRSINEGYYLLIYLFIIYLFIIYHFSFYLSFIYYLFNMKNKDKKLPLHVTSLIIVPLMKVIITY